MASSEVNNLNLRPRPASKGGEARSTLVGRPPIVAVMGHVDHGKTTLLDYIRKISFKARATSPSAGEPRSVAEREAGGITQSIGAYEIEHSGRKITFIDTPGHEAFSAMRSRGAHLADLAILVVAGDEGVKPQTKESVKILEETKTPFVVAITKADKQNADIEKVKNELAAAGVLLEGYGGQVSYQSISSKTGEHVNELLDLILLTADLENLAYDPLAPASGYVLETRVDRQRGLEATLVLKNGTLREGDFIVTGSAVGRVKILENFLEDAVAELLPSSPALVIGFEKLPAVGEEFVSGADPKALMQEVALVSPLVKVAKMAAAAAGEKVGALNVVLKSADTGSLEVLSQIMQGIAATKPLKIVGASVGEVNDNDVKLAISAGAVVIAFKSKTDKAAKALADANRAVIISSDVVYDLTRAIELFLAEREKPAGTGTLEVLAVFNQAKPERQVVGGKVVAGVFRNKAAFDIEREGSMVGSGRILNLQEQKKDTHEVREGSEAGLLANSTTLIKVGDKLAIQ